MKINLGKVFLGLVPVAILATAAFVTACGSPEPETIRETVIETVIVEIEKPVTETVVVEKAVTVKETVVVVATTMPAMEAPVE